MGWPCAVQRVLRAGRALIFPGPLLRGEFTIRPRICLPWADRPGTRWAWNAWGSSRLLRQRGGVAPPGILATTLPNEGCFRPADRPGGEFLVRGLGQPRRPWFLVRGIPPPDGGSVSLRSTR